MKVEFTGNVIINVTIDATEAAQAIGIEKIKNAVLEAIARDQRVVAGVNKDKQ